MAATRPSVLFHSAEPTALRHPELTEAQRRAAAGGHGARLVVGGAGSGKTTVLIEAMAAELAGGAPRDQMIGLAPTQSAARRWRAAVTARTGRESPLITTIHSLALQRVRAAAAERGGDPPRLLSVPDQVAIVRDILAASPARRWPDFLAEALRTRAFAEAARDFIARAAALGWTPARLRAHSPAPESWQGLAALWRKYLGVLALSGATDYAGLISRATRDARNGPWALVCLDDYQELDPAQQAFACRLPAPGGLLIAAADPDQVVNRFRGAASGSVAEFGELFEGAALIVLEGCHRFGARLESMRSSLVAPLPMAGLPANAVRAHRLPRAADASAPDTVVDALCFGDPLAEAVGIATIIRRFATAGRADAAPNWRGAAVLVRSADQLAAYEDALIAAGVPIRGATGRWLADEPVARLLATGLRLAARAAGLPVDQPPASSVMDLLVSPMVGTDPVDLRHLVRHLRGREVASAPPGQPPRTSAQLVLALLADPPAPSEADLHDLPGWRGIQVLRRRIRSAASRIEAGQGAAEALWALWSDDARGPGAWAEGLRARALRHGPGSGIAHRGLDAAIALFAEAQRSVARGGTQPVLDFLAELPMARWPGQRLTADPAESRNAVLLTTAHRAAGRQWPLVVVAGVQEGVWPGDAAGVGLLGEEHLLGPDQTMVALRSEQVADERRLFHLACTRAVDHLVVTCVSADGRDPGGMAPSRFLDPFEPREGAASATGRSRLRLIGELRRTAADERCGAGLRRAAIGRLADLQDDAAFPGADVASWWGLAQLTSARAPLVDPGQPVTLSVTGLSELAACPWRWLATRALGASGPEQIPAAVGRMVHRINQAWANSEIEPDLAAVEPIVDAVWRSLPFDAPWYARRRRAEVVQALERLLGWQKANGERIAAAEEPFEVDVDLPDGTVLRLRGKADLTVRHGEDGLTVIDVKTAKSAPSRSQVARHVQLTAYQLAVMRGGLGAATAVSHGSGLATATATATATGAGLLLASVADGPASGFPKVVWQAPLDLDDPSWSWFADTMRQAVRRLRSEDFPPIESGDCRTCPVASLCPAKRRRLEVGQ